MSIDLRRSFSVPSFTFATLPASYPVGQPVWVSDIGRAVIGASPVAATGSLWAFNGTVWVPVGGAVLLAKLDTVITGLTNVAAIAAQLLLPAGFLKVDDRIQAWISLTKSGTTDSGVIRTYMGTAGTTSDDDIGSGTVLAASNRSYRALQEWRVASATSLQRVSNSIGTVAASSGQMDTVTIANISNALYIDLGATSSSTNDTVGFADAQIWLVR